MRLRPNSTVAFRIGVFGIWEPEVTKIIRRRITPSSVCVDVGANVGYYSLLMANAAPKGQIFAIEPSPEILAELSENITLNGLTNVTVVPFGASDKEEVLSFDLLDNNRGSSRFTDTDGQVKIPLRALIDLIPADCHARVEIMKIDVEGMESRVLAHLVDHLALFPNLHSILIELRIDDTVRRLLDRLGQAGFKAEVLANEYSSFFYADRKPRFPQEYTSLPDGMYDFALTRDLEAGSAHTQS